MEDEIAFLPLINEQEIKNVGAWGKDGGEKQEILYDSKVMVVGSGILSQMLLANLVGLGVGSICCVDEKTINSDDVYPFLYSKGKGSKNFLGEKRVKHIAATLELINPPLNITYRESPFESRCAEEFNPEVIVETTNSLESKNNCLDYCVQECLPLISVTSSQESAELSIWNSNGDGRAKGLDNIVKHGLLLNQQGSYTSGVIAGLAAEQIRKLKFLIDDRSIDEPLKTGHQIVYNPSNGSARRNIDFKDFSVLVIGAGAIGNFVALNLALLGTGNIDIIDGDKVEHHNLNRQLLLYGKVGDFKAEVLSKRIKEINGLINGDFYNCYLTDEETSIIAQGKNGKEYDAIFGCVDNHEARYLINRSAVRLGIPYIDGGTSATGGRVAVYVPGKNRCIDCQLNLKEHVNKEKPKREGCADNPNPAIVIPNIIIGSSMAAEFVNILSGTPQLLDQMFSYDTYSKNRIYFQPTLMIGRCESSCL